MRGRFSFEDPKNILATIKLTATLEEWETLRDELQGAKWPAPELSNLITDLLAKGRKIVWSSED